MYVYIIIGLGNETRNIYLFRPGHAVKLMKPTVNNISKLILKNHFINFEVKLLIAFSKLKGKRLVGFKI